MALTKSNGHLTRGIVKTDEPRQVMICGYVLPYEAKAPYVESGLSLEGALEYDPTDDTIKCHDCGLWLHSLAKHVIDVHNSTATHYRINHGLRGTTALIADGAKAKHKQQMKKVSATRKHRLNRQEALALAAMRRSKGGATWKGKPETLNVKGFCRAQIAKTIKEHELRLLRPPSVREVGINFARAAVKHYGSWSVAIAANAGPEAPRCQCRPDCGAIAIKNRKFARGHKEVQGLRQAS